MKKYLIVFFATLSLLAACKAAQSASADSAYAASQLDCVAKQDAGSTPETKAAALAASKACRAHVDEMFGVSDGGVQ